MADSGGVGTLNPKVDSALPSRVGSAPAAPPPRRPDSPTHTPLAALVPRDNVAARATSMGPSDPQTEYEVVTAISLRLDEATAIAAEHSRNGAIARINKTDKDPEHVARQGAQWTQRIKKFEDVSSLILSRGLNLNTMSAANLAVLAKYRSDFMQMAKDESMQPVRGLLEQIGPVLDDRLFKPKPQDIRFLAQEIHNLDAEGRGRLATLVVPHMNTSDRAMLLVEVLRFEGEAQKMHDPIIDAMKKSFSQMSLKTFEYLQTTLNSSEPNAIYPKAAGFQLINLLRDNKDAIQVELMMESLADIVRGLSTPPDPEPILQGVDSAWATQNQLLAILGGADLSRQQLQVVMAQGLAARKRDHRYSMGTPGLRALADVLKGEKTQIRGGKPFSVKEKNAVSLMRHATWPSDRKDKLKLVDAALKAAIPIDDRPQ